MKLTLIGNGIMAQSLAIGLVKEHEVEMIGRELNKLKLIKEKIPELQIKELSDKEDISGKNIIFCVEKFTLKGSLRFSLLLAISHTVTGEQI